MVAKMVSEKQQEMTSVILLRVEVCAGEIIAIAPLAAVNSEKLHQTRVSVRKLRCYLGIFRSAFDPLWVEHMLNELRWLNLVLREVRSADVLEARISEICLSYELTDVILKQFVLDHTQVRIDLVEALGSVRFADLIADLKNWDPFREVQRSDVDFGALLKKGRKKEWNRFKGLANARGADLHKVRIFCKKIRYISELSSEVQMKDHPRRILKLRAIQDLLGKYHDSVELVIWLQSIATIENVQFLMDLEISAQESLVDEFRKIKI